MVTPRLSIRRAHACFTQGFLLATERCRVERPQLRGLVVTSLRAIAPRTRRKERRVRRAPIDELARHFDGRVEGRVSDGGHDPDRGGSSHTTRSDARTSTDLNDRHGTIVYRLPRSCQHSRINVLLPHWSASDTPYWVSTNASDWHACSGSRGGPPGVDRSAHPCRGQCLDWHRIRALDAGRQRHLAARCSQAAPHAPLFH